MKESSCDILCLVKHIKCSTTKILVIKEFIHVDFDEWNHEKSSKGFSYSSYDVSIVVKEYVVNYEDSKDDPSKDKDNTKNKNEDSS